MLVFNRSETIMLDYLKYYLGPLVQITSCVALMAGGDWVWLGIAYFPILAILDSLLPRDLATRTMENQTLANIPVWMSTVLGPLTYFAMAWGLAHHSLTGWQMLGAGLSCAWLSVLPLIPAAHELYHARGRIGRTVARYSQVVILDSTRMELHVAGHHLDVATVADSDTAARGLSLYTFAPRAVLDTSILAQKLNSDALEKRGLGRWSIQHMLWRAILAQVLFQSVIFMIGGWYF
jgi:p-cymene methyl-monooxygenase